MLSINTNISSLIAQQSMSSATNKLNQAIERMTTGYKINGAKDNAANYSISNNMQTQISSYDVAADNVAMGMDLVTTASDIINSMQDKATRLQALCTQARNGTYGAQSMSAIDSEAAAIMAEINRLYQTAEYNNVSLFNREAYQIDESLPQAKAEYNGFIEDPKTYTDAEVAAMTRVADVSTFTNGQKYSISSVEELQKLADYVNAGNDTTGVEFVLGADIDLSSISNWTPIGIDASYRYFSGIFDGNGHVIKNLTIDNPTEGFQGLFGYVELGEIKNVGVVNCNVNGYMYVGGLIGSEYYSTISNCYATGNVSGNDRVGGLIGEACTDTVLTNCYATGNVSGNDLVGGLVGLVTECMEFNNSYATGNVSGNDRVGGLVGEYEYCSSLSNSYATGAVSGNNRVGALIGAVIDWGTFSLDNTSAIKSTTPIIGYYSDDNAFVEDPAKVQEYENQVTRIQPKPTKTTLQVGINSDESSRITFDTNFKFDLSPIENNIASDEALAAVNDFTNLLSEKSTQLGAVQNRLDSALESITVNMENLTSSLSTIRDADIAEVSSQYIQQQILQQASATLLATANQSPSIALQLI